MGLADFLGATVNGPGPAPQWGGTSAGTYAQGMNAAQGRNSIGQGMGGASQYGLGGYQQDYQNAQGNAAQARGSQQDALGLMQSAAQGNQPSVAQMQMQAGTEDSIKAQMAAANSARGGGAAEALAQRNAQNNAAQAQQTNVFNTGMERAQEMAQARGQYGEMAGSMRGQDLASQQQAMAGQQMAYNTAQAQAQLGLANTAQNDTMSLGMGGLGNQAAGAQLNADTANQALQQQAQEFNASQNSSMVSGMVGAATGLAGAGMMSDIRAKTDVAPQGRMWGTGLGAPSAPMQGVAPPGAGGPPSPTFTQNMGRGLMDVSRSLTAAPPPQPMPISINSDERAKFGASRDTAADQFLSTLQPYTYRYKNPDDEPRTQPTGRPYLGIMAQNVERGPTGGTIVANTPRGKAIELGPMVSALAAGTGRLAQRVGALEGKGGR